MLRKECMELAGEKVFLREITEKDTDDVLKWRNSETVVKNFIYRKKVTRAEHMEWLNNKVSAGRVHQFIVCINTTGNAAGSVYLHNFDSTSKSAESGIFLSEKFLGGGIGTEAYRLLLLYSFETLELHKVKARVLAYNSASTRLHEKTGYTQEAYLREEVFIDGRYEDLILFGVLEQEWKQKRIT
ncbi:MAG: GNAT family N-acetyltransferase [Lachnospiraceae bacterium]|nr:GNAT family N-acetyltransferase [Lachnospiraceae bacterium]